MLDFQPHREVGARGQRFWVERHGAFTAGAGFRQAPQPVILLAEFDEERRILCAQLGGPAEGIIRKVEIQFACSGDSQFKPQPGQARKSFHQLAIGLEGGSGAAGRKLLFGIQPAIYFLRRALQSGEVGLHHF